MSTSASSSPQNVIARFGNHISTIPSRSAYKIVYKQIGVRALALKKKSSSTDVVQNRSFQILNRTKMAAKCTKEKNSCAKRAKVVFFSLLIMQFCDIL